VRRVEPKWHFSDEEGKREQKNLKPRREEKMCVDFLVGGKKKVSEKKMASGCPATDRRGKGKSTQGIAKKKER